MGYWGVRSYENDEAHEAIDRAFEQVHGATYDDLMDDANPMTPDQIAAKLASPSTLGAAVANLREEFGIDWDEWDEVAQLAFAGVVVRHAEFGVPIPTDWRDRAVSWLEGESIDWDEATLPASSAVSKEIELLQRAALEGLTRRDLRMARIVRRGWAWP